MIFFVIKFLEFVIYCFRSKEELDKAKWIEVGKVINLWIYPVKSCAGIKVDSAFTAKLGLQNGVVKDRQENMRFFNYIKGVTDIFLLLVCH